MATYKGIQGYTVQKLSSDPTASEASGQLWYNSDTGKFKVGTAGAGAWATGGVLNSGRSDGASAGTQAAGLFFTGEPPPSKSNANESYNGATWTEEADVLVARYYAGGTGTQTAAMCIGGQANPGDITNVETWNGTSWTEGNNILSSKYGSRGVGSTTAALLIG